MIFLAQSDISLASASEDRREGAGAVGPRLREFQHTRRRVLELQGVDLILHVSHAVAADCVQNLLGLRCRVLVDRRSVQGRFVAVLCDVGVDLRGVDRTVIIRGIDRSEGVAAILLPYRLFILYFL